MIQHLLSKTNKSSIFQRRSLAASTLIDAYRPRLHKASWCALTFPSTRCSHDPCRVLAELFVILRETIISLLVSGSVWLPNVVRHMHAPHASTLAQVELRSLQQLGSASKAPLFETSDDVGDVLRPNSYIWYEPTALRDRRSLVRNTALQITLASYNSLLNPSHISLCSDVLRWPSCTASDGAM
jgi:hypothetical protein